MSCTIPSRPCTPSRHAKGADFKRLIRHYKRNHRPNSLREFEFFRDMPSLDLVLVHAGKAVDERNKRFSHQRRHSEETLRRAHQVLGGIAAELRGFRRFRDLHRFIEGAIMPIAGLNEMYIYDTAVRIGAYLGLQPERVYLHRGTRDGACALGLSVTKGFLNIDELPRPLQELTPDELEDFLCIYKHCFENAHGT